MMKIILMLSMTMIKIQVKIFVIMRFSEKFKSEKKS